MRSLAAMFVLLSAPVLASPAPDAAFTGAVTFNERTGEALFKNVCAGCHMPDAKGAAGAGVYPALAANAKLRIAGYPIAMVMNGRKAMPSFGPMMDDEQIAAVVNYVRTNFGNGYADAVTAADVKAVRP
jgi:mono/diheme cytochrome c family protein